MKKLLNTLFVLTENAYLSLDGENVVINVESNETGRFPLHALEGIYSFSYSGASPALMGACAERNVNLCFHTPNGRFLARIMGLPNGNVLLRRKQYRLADDMKESCSIARNMIFGKIFNARWNIGRTLRDHQMRIDVGRFQSICEDLNQTMKLVTSIDSLDQLRGVEGEAASRYFSVFDEMILGDKKNFYFHGRNRRPPLDNVNAMLSFVYSLLTNDCTSALEAAGLDAYVGFMHRDRPGRKSLALDIMEELRPCLADRFVLTCINNRVISASEFRTTECGAVVMSDEGRKKIIKAWQERKREIITHPYVKEKISWGLVPYIQALLLARYLRGDLDGYPPFLWK